MNYENGDVINPFPEVLKSHKKGLPDRNKNHYHSHNNNILGSDAFFSIWLLCFNVMLEYIYPRRKWRRKKLFAENSPPTPPSILYTKWHGKKSDIKKEKSAEKVREWNENDGINVKSPHYIDGFYSHSFFCFVGTDNSTVTTISIFGWEHILIEASEAKKEQKRMRKSIQLAIKANIKIIWY